LGGSNQDSGSALAVDATANTYITGWTDSTNYPTTPGAFQRNLAGAQDVFVTKLDANGSALLYSTYLGGGEGDEPGTGNAIVVDATGSAYITGKVGRSSAGGFPVTYGAFQTQFGGYGDAFLTKFYPSGALQYSTFLGGARSDKASALSYADLPPQVYVTGITESANFPVSPGGYSLFYSGGSDAFLADLQIPVAEHLVFVSYRNGNAEIYRMSANGANIANLTNHQANDWRPLWSPIASTIVFQSDRDGQPDLYAMGSDGSGVTRLTDSSANELDVDWSSDGRQIAFSWNEDNTYGLAIMDADGANRKDLLTTEVRIGSLAWSPQRHLLAFEMVPPCADEPTNCERYDIYTIEPDGSNLTNLTRNQSVDSYPAWSPDGTRIAFASWRDGDADIYVLHLASYFVQTLTANSHYDNLPKWSPSGSHIAFISARDGNEEIYTVTADGSNQVNLTRNAARDSSPVWSLDSNRLAFVTSRDGNDEIYIMNANGSGRINVTNHPGGDVAPAWDPTWY
jgi:Tol biopolymer transport system component